MMTWVAGARRAAALVFFFALLPLAQSQNIGPAGAISLDGLDDYVEVAPNASLTLSNQVTFEAWVYPTESRCNTILSRGPQGEDFIFQVGYNGAGDCTTRRVAFSAAGGWDVSTGTVPLNAWTHVAVTYDRTNKHFYINGVPSGSAPRTAALAQVGGPLIIGQQGTPSGCNCNRFKGQLDEVRIWNTVRSAAEISENMRLSLNGPQAGLAAYYRFDYITGITTRDSSGNGNTGKLLNRPVPVPSTVPFPLFLALDGPNPLTNDCNIPFADPGVTVRAAPFSMMAEFGSDDRMVLRADGTVLRWRNSGLLASPAAATNLIAAAITFRANFGLRANGTILAWGDNDQGELNVPASATNVVALRPGGAHVLALKANGTVVAWGLNSSGQANVPATLSGVVAIAAGAAHSLALKADGTMVAWGGNTVGQTTIPATGTNVIAISAGRGHNLALRADGTVIAWGANTYGESTLPVAATNLVAIAAGDQLSVALRADGTVIAWGLLNPASLTSSSNLVAIGAGGVISCMAVTTDGALINLHNAVDIPPAPRSVYELSVPVTTVGTVNAGVFGSYPLVYNATNSAGATGTTNRSVVVADITPPAIYLTGANPMHVAVGTSFADPGAIAIDQCTGDLTASISVSGTVNTNVPGRYQITYSATDIHGNTRVMVRTVFVRAQPVPVMFGANRLTNECHFPFVDPGAGIAAAPLAIDAGAFHALVLKIDGRVAGWGDNNFGQLNIPSDATNLVAVTAGYTFTAALRDDGTVLHWGDIPPAPASATNIVAIDAFSQWVFALKADGTVMTLNGGDVPAHVNDVVAIAAGYGHGLALQADGDVLAWGSNFAGQTNVPPNARNAIAVAAGSAHSLALKADGTVIGWGRTNYGLLNIPAGLSNVVAIAAGEYFNLALKSDGTVISWGDLSPALPADATNIVAIAANEAYSLAIRADGTVLAWGEDFNGGGTTDVPPSINQLNLPPTITGVVNTNVPGAYVLTYFVTNLAGGTVTNSRTVVVEDRLPPKVTLVGANPLQHIAGNPFIDPGVTASDMCAGDLTASVVVSGTVTHTVPGQYTLSYTVTDPSGHSAATNRTVRVVAPPAVSDFAWTFQSSPALAAVTFALNGAVNPNGLPSAAYFEYGLSPYGVSTAPVNFPAAYGGSNISALTVNLSHGVIYHWRLIASNSVGVTYGPDQIMAAPALFAAGDLDGDGTVSQSEVDAVLANYYPNAPWLQMTNVAGLGGTNVTFGLSNPTAGSFSVEYSTNLTDWLFLGPAIPRYEFNDTNAPTSPQRYYRLRWP